MSGSSYPLSGDSRQLLSHNDDFFASIGEALSKAKLDFLVTDKETRIERVQNGDKIEITFVYPLDTNADPSDGRLYLRDKFVFGKDSKKYEAFKREVVPSKSNTGKNWEEWLATVKAGKDPSKEQAEKFAATLAQRFVGTEYWRSFDEKFLAALASQEGFLKKTVEPAAVKYPNLIIKFTDPHTAFAIRYPEKDLEVVITYAFDNDDDVMNGRVLLTDTLLIDGTTKKLKKVIGRQWSLSPQAEGNADWEKMKQDLQTIPQPSDADFAPFVDAIAPTLPLLSEEKFHSTLKALSPTESFIAAHGASFDRRGKKSKAEREARVAAGGESLEMLSALANERLSVREDGSKGWAHFGSKFDAKANAGVLKGVFERAQEQFKSGTAKSAFEALQAAASTEAERKALSYILEDKLCQQLNDAGREPNLKVRRHSLMVFARSTLLMEYQLANTARFIADKLKDDPFAKERAAELISLIDGTGSFSQKAELFSNQFVERASDPAMITAMTVAGVAGPTAELFGLRIFGNWAPTARNVAAALGGIAVESFTFTAVHKIGHGAHHDMGTAGQFFKEWGAAASLFVGMRLIHTGTGWASTRMAESGLGQRLKLGEALPPGALPATVGPTGRVLPNFSKAQLTSRGEWLSAAMNHGGGVFGMTGAGYFNQWVGLAEQNKQGFWGHVNDAGLMYFDSMIGFGMANRASGGRLQATVGDLRLRIETQKGTLSMASVPDGSGSPDPATVVTAAGSPGAPPPDPKFSIFQAVKGFFARRASLKGEVKSAQERITALEAEKAEAQRQLDLVKADLTKTETELTDAKKTATDKDGEITKIRDDIDVAERKAALQIALARSEGVDHGRAEEAKRLEGKKQEVEQKIKELDLAIAATSRQLPPAGGSEGQPDSASVAGPRTLPTADPSTLPAADGSPTVAGGPKFTLTDTMISEGLSAPAGAARTPSGEEPTLISAQPKMPGTTTRTLVSGEEATMISAQPKLPEGGDPRATRTSGGEEPTVIQPAPEGRRMTAQLERQLEEAAVRIGELDRRNTELVKELATRTQEKTEAEESAGDRAAEAGRFRADLKKANKKLGELEAALETAKGSQTRVVELETELNQSRDRVTTLEKEIETKGTRIAELEGPAARTQALETERVELVEKRTELETQLATEKEKAQGLDRDLAAEKTKLEEAKEEFDSAKNQLERINAAAERRAEDAENLLATERQQRASVEEESAPATLADPSLAAERAQEKLELEQKIATAEQKAREAEGKLETANREIAGLEEKLRSQGEETSTASTRAQAQKAEFERQLQEANNSKLLAEAELTKRVAEVGRLTKEAEVQTKAAEARKAEWEAEQARLEGAAKGHEFRAKELEADLRRSREAEALGKELQEATEKKLQDLGKEMEEATAVLADFKRRLTELDKAKEASEGQAKKDLERKARALTSERELTRDLNAQLEAAQTENQALTAKAAKDVADIKAEKENAEAEAKRIGIELEQLQAAKARGEQDAAGREAELTQKLEDARRVVGEQTAALEKAKQKLESVESAASQREMELSQTIFVMGEQAKDLNREIETLTGALRVKETRVQRLSDSETSLRRSVGKANREILELRSSLDAATAEAKEAKTQVTKLEKQVVELTAERDKLLGESRTQRETLAALEIERNGLRNQVQALTGQLSTANTKVTNREAELAKAEARIEELNGIETDLTTKLRGSDAQLQQATKELAAREKNLEELRATTADYVAGVNERLRKAGTLIDKKEGDIRDLQNLVREKIEEFVQLQRQRLELENALRDRGKELNDLEANLEKESKRADLAETERDIRQQIIEGKDTEIAEKKSALSAAMSTVRKLSEAKSALEKELQETKETLDKTEKELSATAVELNDVSEAKTAFEAESRSRVVALEAKIAERVAEIAELEKKLKAETGRADRSDGLARAMGKDIIEKRQEIERLAGDLTAERERSTRFGASYLEIKKQFESKSGDLDREQKKAANLKRQIATIRDSRERSETRLNEVITGLREELKERGRLIDAAKIRATALDAELARVKEEKATQARPLEKKIRELQATVLQRNTDVEAAGRSAQLAREQLDSVRGELTRLNNNALERNKTLQAQLAEQKAATGAEHEKVREITAEMTRAEQEHAQVRATLELEVRRLSAALGTSDKAHLGAVALYRTAQQLLESTREAHGKALAQKNSKISELQDKALQLEKALLAEKRVVELSADDVNQAKSAHARELEIHQKILEQTEETLARRVEAFKELQRRQEALQRTLEQERDKGAASVRTFGGLSAELARKVEEIEQIKGQLNAEKAVVERLKSAEGEWNKLKGELEQRSRDLESKVQEAEEGLARARAEIESKQTELEVKEEELEGAKGRARDLEKTLEEKKGELEAAEKTRDEKIAETREAERQMSEANRLARLANAAKEKADRELAEVRGQAGASAEQAARIPELERVNAELTAQAAERERTLEARTEEVQTAKQAQAAAEEKERAIGVDLALETDKLREANEKLVDASTQFSSLQNRLVEAQDSLSYYRQLLVYREQRAQRLWAKGAQHIEVIYPLDMVEANLIGRASACDIIIPERSVSRQQAQLWFDGETWKIRDVRDLQDARPIDEQLMDWNPESRSRINGEAIAPGWYELKDMDIVGYGTGRHFDEVYENNDKRNVRTSYKDFGDVILVFRIDPETKKASLQEVTEQEAHIIRKQQDDTHSTRRDQRGLMDTEEATQQIKIPTPMPPEPIENVFLNALSDVGVHLDPHTVIRDDLGLTVQVETRQQLQEINLGLQNQKKVKVVKLDVGADLEARLQSEEGGEYTLRVTANSVEAAPKSVEPAPEPVAPPVVAAVRSYVGADVVKAHELKKQYKPAMEQLFGGENKDVALAMLRLRVNFPAEVVDGFSLDVLAAAKDKAEQKAYYDNFEKALKDNLPENAGEKFWESAKADLESLKKPQKGFVSGSPQETARVMHEYGAEIRELFGLGTDLEAKQFATLYQNFPSLEKVFNPRRILEDFSGIEVTPAEIQAFEVQHKRKMTPEELQSALEAKLRATPVADLSRALQESISIMEPEKVKEKIQRYVHRKAFPQVHYDKVRFNEQEMSKQANPLLDTLRNLLTARLAPSTMPELAENMRQWNQVKVTHLAWDLDPAQGAKITREFFNNDPHVSRDHADLFFDPAQRQWVLRDHSGNGSLINGQRIHRADRALDDGDVMQFGDQIANFNIVNGLPKMVTGYDFSVHADASLGSHSSNQIVVTGTDMLPIHLGFELRGQEILVKDLSHSGTWVNGERMQTGIPYRVAVGSVLALGKIHLQVLEDFNGGLRFMQLPPPLRRPQTDPMIQVEAPPFVQIPPMTRPDFPSNGAVRRSPGPPRFKGPNLEFNEGDSVVLHRVETLKPEEIYSPDPTGHNRTRVAVPMQKKGFFKNLFAGARDLVQVDMLIAQDTGRVTFKVTNLGVEDGVRVTGPHGKDLPIPYNKDIPQHLYLNVGDVVHVEGVEIPLHP